MSKEKITDKLYIVLRIFYILAFVLDRKSTRLNSSHS